MTDRHELQLYLRDTGRYAGQIDGIYGPKTKGAILAGLEDGPDTPLTDQDYRDSAARLQVSVCSVLAFAEVEAAGAGFHNGWAKILPEPHRFSRLTKGRFDAGHPHLSYRRWGSRPYPKTQEERYVRLLAMIELDIYAGFAACSYGKFQILGENHEACGYDNPWAFAGAMAFDEPTQLKAFESFIRQSGIINPLRSCLWGEVARRYNGPAYRKNEYDLKLALAQRRYQQAGVA